MRTKQAVLHNITTWPELGINYWGINKNATSTLITHFIRLTDTGKSEEDHGQQAKRYIKNRYITQSTALTNGLKNFCVTRNPYTRFESCYRQFKFPKNNEQSRSSNKANFNPLWDPNDFLNHIHRKFYQNKPGNKHFRYQHYFCPDPTMLQHCIKLEHLLKHWPFDFPPPKFKTNTTKEVSLLYNEDLLFDIYYRDFKLFGYKKRR